MYSDNDIRLYHHGILGQKWGVQNGPPYPLDSSVSTGKALRKQKKLAKQIKKGWDHTNFKKDGDRYSSAENAAEKNKDLRKAALSAKNVQDSHDEWIKLYEEWFDRSWDDDFDTNPEIFKLKKDEEDAYEKFKKEAGELGAQLLGEYADKTYSDMATQNYIAARGAIMNVIHDDSIRRRAEEDIDEHFKDKPDPYKEMRNK